MKKGGDLLSPIFCATCEEFVEMPPTSGHCLQRLGNYSSIPVENQGGMQSSRRLLYDYPACIIVHPGAIYEGRRECQVRIDLKFFNMIQNYGKSYLP